jgi:hypothetical protein
MINLIVRGKYSPRLLAFSAVFWSCLGGFFIGRGLELSLRARSQYDWIFSLLLGVVYLLFGIFWSVKLVCWVGAPNCR